MKILVLHGINLNMFGKREPELYGTVTLEEIDTRLQALGKELAVQVDSFQTNDEGAMCERIHRCKLEGVDAVLINAGAWSHYSIAIRDALAMLARESFRHTSVFAAIVKGQISGFGIDSYLLALRAAVSAVKAAGKA